MELSKSGQLADLTELVELVSLIKDLVKKNDGIEKLQNDIRYEHVGLLRIRGFFFLS